MLKESYYFLRYGPAILKQQKQLGLVACVQKMSRQADDDGYAAVRSQLVSDLEGDVLEVGAGTGAAFPYYSAAANVTAIEPNEDFRIAAESAADDAHATIRVISGKCEALPFEDSCFDAICASLVLCSVDSPEKTLDEFMRVLRPGGKIRLLDHVCSEHWLAGPLMNLLNPLWLRINQVGCNWNRHTVATVANSSFEIDSVERYKIYSSATPAVFPIRLIKARYPQ